MNRINNINISFSVLKRKRKSSIYLSIMVRLLGYWWWGHHIWPCEALFVRVVRVVCEVFCCQESQLDWPVDSTRTETRRLQRLLLGTRRLQLQSLLLLGARRLQSLLLRTRRLQCLLLLRATRAHLTMWGTLCHHKKKKKEKKNILWQQMSRRTAVCLKNKIIKMSFTYFSW